MLRINLGMLGPRGFYQAKARRASLASLRHAGFERPA
jgi:hypothetical protein